MQGAEQESPERPESSGLMLERSQQKESVLQQQGEGLQAGAAGSLGTAPARLEVFKILSRKHMI